MLLLFFLFLLPFSCTQNNSSHKEQENLAVLDVPNQNVQTPANDWEQFIRLTSFDFSPYTSSEVHAYLDHIENNIALVKLFVDTDGTGTLGWVQINFNDNTVFDITLDPEHPKKLTFDEKQYVTLKEKYATEPEPKDEGNVLLIWSPENMLLSEKLNLQKYQVSLPIREDMDYFVYPLPNSNQNVYSIILSACSLSGYCEEYLVTTTKDGKEIEKLKIYYNSAPDGNEKQSEFCTYKLFKNGVVELKTTQVNEGQIASSQISRFSITNSGKIMPLNK